SVLTGVQTCALPIFLSRAERSAFAASVAVRLGSTGTWFVSGLVRSNGLGLKYARPLALARGSFSAAKNGAEAVAVSTRSAASASDRKSVVQGKGVEG